MKIASDDRVMICRIRIAYFTTIFTEFESQTHPSLQTTLESLS